MLIHIQDWRGTPARIQISLVGERRRRRPLSGAAYRHLKRCPHGMRRDLLHAHEDDEHQGNHWEYPRKLLAVGMDTAGYSPF